VFKLTFLSGHPGDVSSNRTDLFELTMTAHAASFESLNRWDCSERALRVPSRPFVRSISRENT